MGILIYELEGEKGARYVLEDQTGPFQHITWFLLYNGLKHFVVGVVDEQGKAHPADLVQFKDQFVGKRIKYFKHPLKDLAKAHETERIVKTSRRAESIQGKVFIAQGGGGPYYIEDNSNLFDHPIWFINVGEYKYHVLALDDGRTITFARDIKGIRDFEGKYVKYYKEHLPDDKMSVAPATGRIERISGM